MGAFGPDFFFRSGCGMGVHTDSGADSRSGEELTKTRGISFDMENSRIVYWASVLAALGWIYAALASVWPMLFDRAAIKHAIREELGYRIGWRTYWRLPIRGAILVTLLSVIPLLAVTFLRGWLVAAVLTVVTGIIVFLWLLSPPGTRLAYAAKGREGSEILLGVQSSRNALRSIFFLVILGACETIAGRSCHFLRTA